jgi:hypothetical protein
MTIHKERPAFGCNDLQFYFARQSSGRSFHRRKGCLAWVRGLLLDGQFEFAHSFARLIKNR